MDEAGRELLDVGVMSDDVSSIPHLSTTSLRGLQNKTNPLIDSPDFLKVYTTVRVHKQLCLPEALAKTESAYRWLPTGHCELENVEQSTIKWLIQESFRLQGLDKHCLPWKIYDDLGVLRPDIIVDEIAVSVSFHSHVAKGMEKECIYILDHYFAMIAQGAQGWMRELFDIGYTKQDLVLLHFDEYFDRPWIRSRNAGPPASFSEPDYDFHRHGCPHVHSSSSGQGYLEHTPAVPYLRRESASQAMPHRELLSRFCGLAGLHDFLVPPGHMRGDGFPSSQGGYASFNAGNTRAQVRYPESLPYVLERIEGVCSAVACLQTAGLCCNSWTIIIDSSPSLELASDIDSPPTVELHSIIVQTVLHLRQALRRMNLSAIATTTREIFIQMVGFPEDRHAASRFLARIFGGDEASRLFQEPASVVSMRCTIKLVALATQVLSLSLVSFAGAHVGTLKLGFLLENLDMVTLTGCGRYNHITVYLQRLTCLNGMVNQPMRVFSIHDVRQSLSDAEPFLREQPPCHLRAKAEDTVDTFGGNILFASNVETGNCLAISIGGGLITPNPGSISEFHWSAGYHLQHSSQFFSRTEIMTVGSLVVNPNCSHDIRISRQQVCTHLRALGTCRPSWELNERELGIQAGQYFNLTGPVTFSRIPGISLKKVLLDILWSALERPYGLQISVCTALARRVPLRIALADNLSPYVESNRPYPPRWKELRDVHKISDALRTSNFKTWYDDLADDALRASVDEVLRKQTIALGNTGIQSSSGSDHLVVAWWSAESSNASIHLDLSHEANAWARMLKDTPETATFAYVTEECLESRHQKCLKESMLIKTGVTRMLLTELHESPDPSLTLISRVPQRQSSATCQLLPDTTYDIGPEGGCLVAKVRSTSRPDQLEIEVSQLRVPARIWRRAQGRRPMMRLVERGAYVESDRGQEVHISSGADTSRIISSPGHTRDPRLSLPNATVSESRPTSSVFPATVPLRTRAPHTIITSGSSMSTA